MRGQSLSASLGRKSKSSTYCAVCGKVTCALSFEAPQHVCAHKKNTENSPEGFGGQQDARGQA